MIRPTRLVVLPALVAAAAVLAACGASSSGSGSTTSPAIGKAGRPNGGAAAPDSPGEPAPETPASGETLAAKQPQSTFAMDVDTASYTFARRQLLDGRRPTPSAVRPEEFVNAFRQDYPQPAGNGFAVQVDGAQLPAGHRVAPPPTGAGAAGESTVDGDGPGGAVRLMRVGLQTRTEDRTARADAALTFVIDVSGSMAEPGKLDLVKDALRTLVGQLRPTDAVAIVAYNDHAQTLRPMTPTRDRAALLAAVDKLQPGGSTNLGAGLVEGYRVARAGFRAGAANRVILLSDGLANVGDTSADPILRQVREEADKKIALLGVGVGSDYGDALMEQLADHGDGFVVYVSEPAQARRVFVEQLPATLAVRAMDAKVQVTFDPATVLSYRLVGYDDRALNPSDFRNDHVDGGEVGPGHAVTALYLVRLRASTGRVAEARIRWQDPATRVAAEAADTVSVGQLSGAFTAAPPRLRVSYVAAYFAESLRGGPYGTEARLGDLASVAVDAARETNDPDVSDLADLIRKADRLAG